MSNGFGDFLGALKMIVKIIGQFSRRFVNLLPKFLFNTQKIPDNLYSSFYFYSGQFSANFRQETNFETSMSLRQFWNNFDRFLKNRPGIFHKPHLL